MIQDRCANTASRDAAAGTVSSPSGPEAAERYASWDYLGDEDVCPLTDDHRTLYVGEPVAQGRPSQRTARLLVEEDRRRAFVRLMRLYVDHNRVTELPRQQIAYLMAASSIDQTAQDAAIWNEHSLSRTIRRG